MKLLFMKNAPLDSLIYSGRREEPHLKGWRFTAAAAIVVVFLTCHSAARADLSAARLTGVFDMRDDTDHANFQGSFFYLNDNVNGAGHVTAGQIGWGAWEIDDNAQRVNAIRTSFTLTKDNTGQFFNDPNAVSPSPPIGVKSVVQIGSFGFMAANNEAGLARFLAVDIGDLEAWNPQTVNPINDALFLGPDGQLREIQDTTETPFTADSITMAPSTPTTPTMLFSNETVAQGQPTGRLHGLTLSSNLIDFSTTAVWSTDISNHPDVVNPNPGFRGVAYGDNGFLYAVDTGRGGDGSVWAFNIADGTPTKITDYTDAAGTGDSFLVGGLNPDGSPIFEPIAGYGSIVHDDELWVFGNSGFVSAFEMTSPTTVGTRTDLDFGALLFDAGAAESTDVAIYGMAAEDDTVWLSYEARGERPSRRVAVLTIDPAIINAVAGDLDGDGDVNFSDFAIMQNHLNQPGTRADGDLNGDGMVTFADFAIFQNAVNVSHSAVQAPAALLGVVVPEPTTIALLGLTVLPSLAFKRTRHGG